MATNTSQQTISSAYQEYSYSKPTANVNVDFEIRVQITQPTSGSTSSCQVRIQALPGTYNTEYGTAITSQFKGAGSSWVSGPSVTLTGGTTGTWTTLANLTCNYDASTTFQARLYMTDGTTGARQTLTFTVSGNIYWETSPTPSVTATANPPTAVRVGASTAYANNSAVYNTTAPTPGLFYITWTDTGSVSNHTKLGYQRRAVGSAYGGSTYIEPEGSYTTNLYHLSSGWSSQAVGKTYKCQVRTIGSSVNSAWSSAYGSVVFTASASSYTMTAKANGGWFPEIANKTETTKTSLEYSTVELPICDRVGYQFMGYYYDATGSSSINYGKTFKYTGSFSASFWTYMTAYNTSQNSAVFGCESTGGYGFWFTSAGKAKFEFYDNGSYTTVTSSSAIPLGFHDWCCVFNASSKKISIYMDGSLLMSTTTTNDTCTYNTATTLYLGADYGSSSGAERYLTGYVGNFTITNDATVRSYDPTVFTMPNSNVDVYAMWLPNSANVTINPNGGTYNGTSSVTYLELNEGDTFTLGAAVPPSSSNVIIFDGWYDAATGGNRIGGANDTFRSITPKTIYAHYKEFNGDWEDCGVYIYRNSAWGKYTPYVCRNSTWSKALTNAQVGG